MSCYNVGVKIQIYMLDRLEYEGYIIQAFNGKLGVGTLYDINNWEKMLCDLIKNGVKIEKEKIKFTSIDELLAYLKDTGLNIKIKGV